MSFKTFVPKLIVLQEFYHYVIVRHFHNLIIIGTKGNNVFIIRVVGICRCIESFSLKLSLTNCNKPVMHTIFRQCIQNIPRRPGWFNQIENMIYFLKQIKEKHYL